MEEGTIYLVIPQISGWPPLCRTEVARVPVNGCVLDIVALPNASFEIQLTRESKTLFRFESAALRFDGAGGLLFSFSWAPSGPRLFLARKEIPPRVATGAKVLSVQLGDAAPIPNEAAIGHADANKSCQSWLDWREDRFRSSPKVPSSVQRLKTPSEQIVEFQNAILSLQDIVSLVKQGRTHLTDHISASLRALIYWDSGKKYHPLLLRMAARGNPPMALPVFALPDGAEHAPPGSPILNVRFDSLSATRRYPGQRLMDIQEWLESNVRIEGGEAPLPTLPAKEVILRAASESGAAHYSELTFRPSDELDKTETFGRSGLNLFIFRSAVVILGLATHVLASVLEGRNEQMTPGCDDA